jgi:prepilin-type N-terminal cleavage/methylation domain-containing protein
MSAGVRASRRARRALGFSLIELMVVIIIIGIVSALAVPTMLSARMDRHAYEDAGQIMQFFREARTRAVGRAGAVLIAMTMNGKTDRGTFTMWESVTTNPANAGGGNRSPVATCKAPTVWGQLNAANTGIAFVDSLNLNSGAENDADIETALFVYSPAGVQPNVQQAFICYTPLGRAYLTTDVPVFDGAVPSLAPLELRVTRAGGGTIRSVLVPPSGMARIFSHVP